MRTEKEIFEKFDVIKQWIGSDNLKYFQVKPKNPDAFEQFSECTYYINAEPEGKMGIPNVVIKKAKEEAVKADHKHKIGAAIFNKGKVYSVGRNHSMRSVKHLLPKFKRYPTSIHAEVDSIIKARRDISGLSILVVRVNKKGDLLLAKPCDNCLSYISYVGLKNIYYSNNNGGIERIKL